MKRLVWNNEETSIHLSKINSDFPGIIIAYRADKPIGYIRCIEGKIWCFCVNIKERVSEAPTINDIIDFIQNRYCADKFMVMEFV